MCKVSTQNTKQATLCKPKIYIKVKGKIRAGIIIMTEEGSKTEIGHTV